MSTPKLRDGFDTFALRGDNCWGDSIMWWPTGQTERVAGWTSPRPQDGDRLLVPMESGRWGVYVLADVKRMPDPRDQWFARARGPIGYADDSEVPGGAGSRISPFAVDGSDAR